MNRKIMVCDDSATNLAIIKEETDRESELISDPREVIDRINGQEHDLLLLDYEMPHLNGMEVMALVREKFSSNELPIIIVTGHQEVDIRNKALAMGANDFIHKPLDPVEVALRINNQLSVSDSYRLQQQLNTELEENVRERTYQLKKTNKKFENLVRFGIDVSAQQDKDTLLKEILYGGRDLTPSEAGTLFLVKDDHLHFSYRTMDDELPAFSLPLYDPETGEPDHNHVSTYVALTGETVIIDDIYAESRFDLTGTRQFSEESGFKAVSMVAVPLQPREGEVIGVLQLINAIDVKTRQIIPFHYKEVQFIEALASQAAVALDNHNLLDAQRELIDSIIRLLAGAIDAKSPYTGGHCERVPTIAKMLAQAAIGSEQPLFKDFHLNEAEWREFMTAAWLHDCGKVTTPEHIVDKATKLETIYNRIHEIRMRFEVLLRDAKIEMYEAILMEESQEDAQKRYDQTAQQLQDEFAFIANSNIGGEFMSPEHIERLETISQRTWIRHFDDRLGLSGAEEAFLQDFAPTPVPAREHLLADKPEHRKLRSEEEREKPYGDNPWGFTFPIPQHQVNRGEIYNLSISRGTLTEEDRYIVNDHVIQTIKMLEGLPFPSELSRIPEYAGSHHETMIGTGYPRGLKREEMSLAARIMAIADIFEALTASDRPYKKKKTLSEAIKIMGFMKKDQHIDPDLFDLFLNRGIYKEYADRFLQPDQIDEVDVEVILAM